MDHRLLGQSGYSAWARVRLAATMLLGFSTLPLRLVSYVGLCFGVHGGGLLGYILITYAVAGASVPGFAFVSSMVALFSGVQLVAIGLIGDYLSRLYGSAIGRPMFAIRQIRGAGSRERPGLH
jgi:undecaprenyl-phosphate 4-deoxy-4-formamido-L-arabinose transferase